MADKPITFFDLFAGIGGFHIALKRLGWKCVGFCEIDKPCRKTYFVNFPEMVGKWYCHDARNIKEGELPDFDVLVAGFPCQSFSLAGKRLGFEDTRGTLFFEIVRILKDKKPKAFLLENVKGLVFHDKGKTLKVILNTLKELDYDVHYEVLNSKDFGVPQNRERIFFVGFRTKEAIPFEFPKGFPLTIRLKDIMEKEIPERYYLTEKYVKRFLKSKCENNDKTEMVMISHTKANIKNRRQKRDESWTLDKSGSKMGVVERREPKLRQVGSIAKNVDFHGDRVYDRNGLAASIATNVEWITIVEEEPKLKQIGRTGNHQQDRIYDPNGLSVSLKTSKGGGAGGGVPTGLYKKGIRIRRLTPRECARLQGLPDSFRFPVSDTQSYGQLGNAVTVSVVEAIGTQMEKWM